VQRLEHPYPFDPAYGYDLDGLLKVESGQEPPDFTDFWGRRHARALKVDPRPRLTPSAYHRAGFRTYDLAFESTDDS
jgi:cephalosporin-C deacetylase